MEFTQKTIFTIGHSTHSAELFLKMLKSQGIKVLVDIRRFPGSRNYPHFNRENLKEFIENQGISYEHFEELGGRRKIQKDSKNHRWKNASFRAYADYMETQEFQSGIEKLEEIALVNPTAYMCSEAVWWRCHRSLVSDYLKASGWNVIHIMAVDKTEEHPFTSPARVVDGKVFYSDENLFE